MNSAKKVHFISLGCPKNLVDSEIMLGNLKNDGYSVAQDIEEAGTVVINTCGFINDAKEESIQTILDASTLKQEGGLQNLVVTGCLTQRYKEELVKDLPEVDIFIGSGQFQEIAKILKDNSNGGAQKTYFSLPTYLQQEDTLRINSQAGHRAYLKISEGCKKRCAFCAIPLIRGNLQSRSIDNVVSEAKLLVASGVKELIIISHDFTDYGWDLRRKDKTRTEDYKLLLKRLADESGAKWIRVLYMYPDGIDQELVDLIKSRDNLVNYFDIPLQHISSEMLKKMNRRITKEEILESISLIRKSIPDAVIRTQFIVGFPGETEEHFEELMEFIEEQSFDRVGCFIYSPEEDTKAFTMEQTVTEEDKQIRHDRLMELCRDLSRDRMEDMIGKELEVVVEGVSEETELLLQGRHRLQAPEIDGLTYINDGSAKTGELVKVLITDSHDYDLVGRIIN